MGTLNCNFVMIIGHMSDVTLKLAGEQEVPKKKNLGLRFIP